MNVVVNRSAHQLLGRPAEEAFRGRVHVGQQPVGVHGEEAFAHAAHDGFVELGEPARAALALAAAALLFVEPALKFAPLQPPQPFRFLIQIDENGRLRPQDRRQQRFDEVIDRPQFIGAIDGEIGGFVGGQEDDGGVAGTVAAADELGGGEAVQALHLHVEEDDGEILLEQQAKRLFAGAGRDQVLTEVREDRFQGQQVGRLVVHQQDIGPRGRVVPGAGLVPHVAASMEG